MRIKFDGKHIQAERGDTILEAAQDQYRLAGVRASGSLALRIVPQAHVSGVRSIFHE